MSFSYKSVAKENMEIIHHRNAIRIKPLEGFSFGKMTDASGEQVFEAKEIVFHTPAEHALKGEYYDMEVHVLHETI
jgi:carbonic anhydrase